MVQNSELRARARKQLGDNIFATNWLMGLLICAISAIIVSAVSWTFVGSLIVAGPLAVGTLLVFVGLIRGKDKVDFMDLFRGFTEVEFLGNRILAKLLAGVFAFLWSLLLVIPGIVKKYSYALVSYVSMEHPDWDWRRCLETSTKVMNGKKAQLFMLDLGFIGWYILGGLAFGIGTLWVVPYHAATRANFYESVRSEIV